MTLKIVSEAPPIHVRDDGTALVGETRVPLDTVVYYFWSGSTPEQIVDSFPTLEVPDVYAAIAYYLRHKSEVDVYLRERERHGAKIRALIEGGASPEEIVAHAFKPRLS